MLAQGLFDDSFASDGMGAAMSDLDAPDSPDDCGNDYEWWWQTVGRHQQEEAEMEEVNAMLQFIEGEKE